MSRYTVGDLVQRLLQFEQTAALEIMDGPGWFLSVGSVYDNTENSALYYPPSAQLIAASGKATVVTIEFDPDKAPGRTAHRVADILVDLRAAAIEINSFCDRAEGKAR